MHQGQERLLELEQAIKAQEGQIGTLKVELEEKNRLIGELTMQLERFRQQRGILETKVNGLRWAGKPYGEKRRQSKWAWRTPGLFD